MLEESAVATVVRFDSTRTAFAKVNIAEVEGSTEAGRRLSRSISPQGLVHVLTRFEQG